MSRTSRYLKQNLVYFAPGAIGRNGQRAYATPILIKGLWFDDVQEMLDANGGKMISKATVFVDREVLHLGVLMRWDGTIAELTSTTEPFKNRRAWEIRRYAEVPNPRRLTDILKVAYL
jgi:hypothetical protein